MGYFMRLDNLQGSIEHDMAKAFSRLYLTHYADGVLVERSMLVADELRDTIYFNINKYAMTICHQEIEDIYTREVSRLPV